jgi:hypothetical protein
MYEQDGPITPKYKLSADICNYEYNHNPTFSMLPYVPEFNRCAESLDATISSYKRMPVSDAIRRACQTECLVKHPGEGPSSRIVVLCTDTCDTWLNKLDSFYQNHPDAFKDLTSEDERNIIAKAKSRIHEAYRPYSPFYSDSLSSKSNRVMWVIILIFIIGLIFYMSQQK